MIRFLQNNNRVTKAIFIVIIGVVSVGMVVYLIPGLTGQGATAQDDYATIYPHWYSKILSSGSSVSQTLVDKMARAQLAQQRYPDNPMILGLFAQRVGQQLIQQQILLVEADKLGIRANEEDVRHYLQTGQPGQVIYPNGVFIGDDQYANLVASRFNMTVGEFEDDVKHDIVIRRLQALVTAGATVSDAQVRDDYRKNNIKIKFDYAVLSADDIRKSINPPDAELQSFFTKNAARYASAVAEERKITYFAFSPNDLPGGVPQASQDEIKAYFNAHQADYQTPEQARARHILISVPAGADVKTDAAAKAKAEGLLKQIQSGANFADLAKANSDDPGSKANGGELPFAQHGTMVPEFDKAIFSQKIGDTAIVKTQFGYHIVQVEERKPAHSQDLSEVLPTIQATLIRQKTAAAESNYAQALSAEAAKSGLDKTAAAHHLEVVTTPPVGQKGVISALPDGSQIITKAFTMKQGDAPQSAATGEGYAIFQVTGITAAHAPTFADWKTHVLDDYRDQMEPALLSAKTQQLADKAKSENDLAKAAKEVGATVKTSDLVGPDGQVPDVGQLAQAAPQLLDLAVGAVSGPITSERNGFVAKILDKQEPSAADIAKNFDQTRDQMLEQSRSEAFNVFLGNLTAEYKKDKKIYMNPKNAKAPQIPGMGL
jgi:peptidyl-prolyl cis-trans isomerase D